jgi:hypothetical protein
MVRRSAQKQDWAAQTADWVLTELATLDFTRNITIRNRAEAWLAEQFRQVRIRAFDTGYREGLSQQRLRRSRRLRRPGIKQ